MSGQLRQVFSCTCDAICAYIHGQGAAQWLDFAWWIVAYDHYMPSVVALAQFESFSDALLYKEVVLEVASLAVKEGRSTVLAVVYDELVRRDSCADHVLECPRGAFVFRQEELGRPVW